MPPRPTKRPPAAKATPTTALPADVPVLRVVILRHGEKPEQGDNLSCAGLNRALALPAVLNRLLPAPPDLTYVPLIGTDSRVTSTARMFQTVTPYAVQHNLYVNSNFKVAGVAGLAKELRRKRGTVLVVWEHHHIPGLATRLGLKKAPTWPEDDFDGIWVLDFGKESKKGKAKKPTLTTHRQGLKPAPTCPPH